MRDTREAWLESAVIRLADKFREAGSPLPKVKVTCGWPSRGGTARKKRAIGQCWDKSSTVDKVAQIFISPVLDDIKGPQGVLSTLVHELVHAAVGCAAGHKGDFQKVAKAVGLVKPWTATTAGPELLGYLDDVAEYLGTYPHGAIIPQEKGKTQTTRLLKAECACGYTVRITRKWVDEVGAPHCPNHGIMRVDFGDQDGEGESDE